ncbi:SH3 domain-containing protein [Phormidium sp. CCY1219]|uniref:SH3 domain-containing protein n=1 Tax=Phormidium sp. CCY1219 TaxID=2886104 RepID=UPI002D1F4995|nr:SH3 domain-containing protein [Phormidium sp. CCY1219]MEB3830765.1 SH3 domain-containing protein [Phormidium sp. CCY1219]
MKTFINNLKKTLGLTAAFSLAATAIAPASIANPTDRVSSNRGEFQVAQATSCREVDSNSGLNVRARPWGRVIGGLEENETVSLANPTTASGDWVQIDSPMNGYVAAKFLSYCSASAPEPGPIASGGCREVDAYGGLNVRQRPSVGSDVVTTLSNSQQVEIEGRGSDGWVEVDAPVDGYVAGEYLNYCETY